MTPVLSTAGAINRLPPPPWALGRAGAAAADAIGKRDVATEAVPYRESRRAG